MPLVDNPRGCRSALQFWSCRTSLSLFSSGFLPHAVRFEVVKCADVANTVMTEFMLLDFSFLVQILVESLLVSLIV